MRDQFTLDETDDQIRFRMAWDGVIRQLAQEVPTAWFERFIRPLQPLSCVDGVAVVATPGRFVHDWVSSRYATTIQTRLSDELGMPIALEFQSEPREKAAAAAIAVRPEANRAVTVTPMVEQGFHPHERFSFDTFVVGQSNRLAFAGARAVADDPGLKYNPLFIYGQSGLGKTHLLHAIARKIQHDKPRYPLVYVSAQQFAEEFVTALQNNRIEQFRRQQRSVGVWLVDDIQFIAGKDKTQEEIFHTFNYLHSLGKQIVLTSDRPPRELFLMDERLRSRFEAGLVADVQMPDTETRCAILMTKAAQENIDVPIEVAMCLAESVPGNIRVLEGALTRLVAHASVEGHPLSIDLAQSLVEQYYRGGFAKPGFDQIVKAVSQHYKISSDDIKGTSRKAPIVHARHIAVYITREITGDSWKHIGSLFGDRDHTSMMHGYQKISEMMNGDKDLRAQVKALIRNLHPDAS
jgi:chromosomal replication initiator protein